ncbi:MAG: NUDIX hydrolase [Catenulispora sp.]|nr:NUDIX hydrolase [Catenulispora sp.]
MRTRLVRIATPTYTVGAVVLLFTSTEPRRLLLLRQPPGRGWSLPAGLLERGETPAQGAVREAAEETGIVLDPADMLPASPNAVVHTKGRWVDTVFTADLDPESVQLSVATGRLLGVYGIGPYAADEPTGGLTGTSPGPRRDG